MSACNIETEPDRHEETTAHTLSIHAMYIYEAAIQHAENTLNAMLAENGHSFYLNVTTFGWDERTYQHTRLQTMFMAGQGYDMLIWDGLPLWIHADSGLFANFYELIDEDPDSSREDFFSHVLEAWETDGRLYSFPLSFEFSYVGINTSLPSSIIEQFTSHSVISVHQLLEIYLDLQTRYGDEFGHMALGSNSFLERIPENMQNVLGNFIDFENKTSFLNQGMFTVFLEDLKKAFDMNVGEYWAVNLVPVGQFPGGRASYLLSAHCVFLVRGEYTLDFFDVLFDIEYFTHFIPIACENGHIIISQFSRNFSDSVARRVSLQRYPEAELDYLMRSPTWGSVIINAATDGVMAWEFTKHMFDAIANHDSIVHSFRHGEHTYLGRWTKATPINRSYFLPHITSLFEVFLTQDPYRRSIYGIPFVADEQTRMYNDAISRFEAFNSMPVVVMPYIPSELFENPLHEFLSGFITAQEAAEIIHNRVSLWLIE